MLESALRQSTVLVVDDLSLNRKLQRLFLTEGGYRVIFAEDGIEALQKVKQYSPDLILLDVMMPRMDGYQVCRHIKNNQKTRFIPVILVTALNETESKVKGIEAGADDFLSKPFNKMELLVRVKSLLRIKHLHTELQEKIQQLEEAQIKLKKLAITDGLTGLYNYRFFREQLEKELIRASRHENHVSIVMMDIDHFKQYNDKHGHPAGDNVLKNVAAILKSNIRNIDIAARYGGEEFALILIETNKKAAGIAAEKIRRLIEEHKFKYEETQPMKKITVSMGVATFPEDGKTFDELVDSADKRLYQAKEKGRNQVILA